MSRFALTFVLAAVVLVSASVTRANILYSTHTPDDALLDSMAPRQLGYFFGNAFIQLAWFGAFDDGVGGTLAQQYGPNTTKIWSVGPIITPNTTGDLGQVSIPLSTTVNNGLKMDVFEYTGTNSGHYSNIAFYDLVDSATVPASQLNGGKEWVTFNFGKDKQLEAGKEYAFMLAVSRTTVQQVAQLAYWLTPHGASTGVRNFDQFYPTETVVPDGHLPSIGGLTVLFGGGGAPIHITTIPEPATIALAGLGAAMMMRRRRA